MVLEVFLGGGDELDGYHALGRLFQHTIDKGEVHARSYRPLGPGAYAPGERPGGIGRGRWRELLDMGTSNSQRGSEVDTSKRTKLIALAVLGVAAVGVLGWNLRGMFQKPLEFPPVNEPEAVVQMKEDLAMLKALDRPALEAEKIKREKAWNDLKRGRDMEAAGRAGDAYERVCEELASRPK